MTNSSDLVIKRINYKCFNVFAQVPIYIDQWVLQFGSKEGESLNATLNIYSITKTFNHHKVTANDNISTQFLPGEVTALTGHNGAGKSTLLNQIMGTVKPNRGSITFSGHSLAQEPAFARNVISMMPQLHAPIAGVTLRQAISAIARIRGAHGRALRTEVDKILDTLHMNEWADMPGEKLSGGLRRLTSFAMTVVRPSPILLFDEPTNDVDPVRRKLLWQCLRKLALQDHIVIVVTHNLLEVEQYADRYLLMHHGRLIKDEQVNILSHDRLSSAVLTINAKHAFKNNELPQADRIVTSDEFQYDLFLKADDMTDAVSWLAAKVATEEIRNYRLSPASLNDVYGGLTDGNKR